MLKINKLNKKKLLEAKKRLSEREIECSLKEYQEHITKEFKETKILRDRVTYVLEVTDIN